MAELEIQREGMTVIGSSSATQGVVAFDQRVHLQQQFNVAGNVPGDVQEVNAVRTSPATNLSALRACLQRLDDVQIETLCLLSFPIVYDKFVSGMRRDERINLLLDYVRRNSEEATRLMSLLESGL